MVISGGAGGRARVKSGLTFPILMRGERYDCAAPATSLASTDGSQGCSSLRHIKESSMLYRLGLAHIRSDGIPQPRPDG
jgi:hypothetical protein